MAHAEQEMNEQETQGSVKPATSAMAIAGLVLGIVALVTSWMPILNNGSFFLALLGAIFAIVGLASTLRHTRSGKVLALAGLIICIIACAAVLAAQQATSKAINDAVDSAKNGPAVASTSAAPADTPDDTADTTAQTQDLALGTSVTLTDGLSVSVDSVDTSLTKYDGSPITAVTVTYTNGGSQDASFNVYDWKAQDTQGAQRSQTFYSGDEVVGLDSGTLAPGGTVTGAVCFDGGITKALYYASMLSNGATASWNLS